MSERKSWLEMKQVVGDLRKQLACLSVSLPSSVAFRTFSDGRQRIYFLSAPTNGWEMTLLFVDISPTDNARHLKWLSLVDPKMVAGGAQFSREEQLQWERKRLSTWGITSYELHAPSGRMVFPAASTLYYCWDYGFGSGVLCPTELQGCPEGAKLSPQICPTNPNLVAYVNNNDIWVSICSSEVSERLTFTNFDGISAGDPSYVMQEEFNRYIGFWWQPLKSDKTFRILYEEVDESMVDVVRFQANDGEYSEKLRFPRAGTTNAKSELKIVQFDVTDSAVVDVRTFVMRTPLFDLFEWAEYLVRAGWTPDGTFVWVQMVDRRQLRFEMALIPLTAFIEDGSDDVNGDDPTTAHVIDTQSSDVWINVHDMLAFLPYDCKTETFSFVIASEKTKFRHLYLIHYPLPLEENSPTRPKYSEEVSTKRIALTSGDWTIVGKRIWLDAPRQLVYFLGQRETPLEKHVYVVSLRQPGVVRLLTVIGNSYNVSFNEDCTLAVITYSNTYTYPACEVLRIVHSDWTVEGVTLIAAGHLLESVAAPEIYCPRLYSYQISSGDLLFAMVLKPHRFEAGRKYPTVLHVYGGPEVQLVTNTFKGMRQLRMHMLAAQGYCVIAIDSRGSQHRGLAFEGYIKGRMGTVELADQVEVLHHLASKLGFIDMGRIAIHGWSYGGYLSLMALVQHPRTFKVAIAGAPVTSWHLYDTGYTERYMDLPDLNPMGYQIGSVLNWVKQFPDEDNRLLIIHGLIDENVHFKHTSEFVSALIKEGKPYHLQVYPHERHSLRNIDASKHYETKLLLFLQNYL